MKILTAITNSINECRCRRLDNGKQIGLIAMGVVAGLAIHITLLNLPVVTLSVERQEPYYVTETSYQPVTLYEDYSTEKLIPKQAIIAEGRYKVVPSGVIIPFRIDRPDSRLTGIFENSIPGSFLIYNAANSIIYEKLGSGGNIDLTLQPGNYKAKFQENLMWGEDVYIYLAVDWSEIETGAATQETSILREINTVVSKERTVLEETKYSIWDIISGSYYGASGRS